MLTAGGQGLEFKSGDQGSRNWGFWGLKVEDSGWGLGCWNNPFLHLSFLPRTSGLFLLSSVFFCLFVFLTILEKRHCSAFPLFHIIFSQYVPILPLSLQNAESTFIRRRTLLLSQWDVGQPCSVRGHLHLPAQVTQAVKNLPAMRETWVRSLGLEDLLEEGMATHFSIPAWKIPMGRGAWQATVHGVTKNWTQLSN